MCPEEWELVLKTMVRICPEACSHRTIRAMSGLPDGSFKVSAWRTHIDAERR